MRFAFTLLVACLFCAASFAGDITPVQKTNTATQKTTTTLDTPAQKNAPAVPQSTPTQKSEVMTPTQKTTTYGDPVQKTTIYGDPVQKTGAYQKGYTTAADIPVPIPQDLLDKLARLQPQECQPLRNLARCVIRKCVKKKIGEAVEDRLPLPIPTPPGNGPLPIPTPGP